EDAAELIFKMDPVELRQPVRRPPPPPPPPPTPTAEILAQLARSKPEPAAADDASLFPEIDEAERDAALDAVLREIVADADAAFRTIAVLYQDFLVRCRIHRVPGQPLDLAAFKRRLAIARAGVDEAMASDDAWQEALRMSESLTDDI